VRFLIVDDDPNYRHVLRYHIEVEWPDALVEEIRATTVDELKQTVASDRYDAVLVGIPMEREPGFGWVGELTRRTGCPPLILFAEPSDEFLAVDAMKAGAASYFPKARVTHQRLVSVIREGIRSDRVAVRTGFSDAVALGGSMRYRLERALHETDVAAVYLAEPESGGKQVAFKVIRYVPDSGGERLFDRFLQEFEVIAALEHPNVVQIYDLGIADDHAYIAMEYLSAGSLAERLNGRLDPATALDYTRQIAGALEAVHAAGILHRDLKPANIMFREDGSLALIDFGLAKHMKLEAALTGAGQIFGTPYYMSPEQGHAEQTDQRSDLYSLGCLLYEMLTGQRPFVAATAMGVIYKHAKAERPVLPAELAAFRPALDRLLAARSAERFGSASELLAALDSITV